MDRLIEIFSMQRSLMRHFMEIERRNGLLLTDQVPLALQSFVGQARLRDFGWRVVEELTEALEATSDAEFREELIDALHFLVELCILAGVEAEQFYSLPEYPDRLESLLSRPGRTDVLGVIRSLGRTLNQLRNRPWKQTSRPVIRSDFQAGLRQTLIDFLSLCRSAGLEAGDLFAEYRGKHATNVQRIEAGQ